MAGSDQTSAGGTRGLDQIGRAWRQGCGVQGRQGSGLAVEEEIFGMASLNMDDGSMEIGTLWDHRFLICWT